MRSRSTALREADKWRASCKSTGLPKWPEMSLEGCPKSSRVWVRLCAGITGPASTIRGHDAAMLSMGSGLEGTSDLEPDRADLDGEHPVALVQGGDAMLKCLFGLPGGA
jgi:hypothetical protein